MPLETDTEIAALLRETTTIAVVGASANPARASNGVLRFLIEHGYEATAVNPTVDEDAIHGAPVVDDLSALSSPPDMVDVFRDSAHAGEVVDQAIAAGAKSVWMQLGVIDEAAATRAEDAGLKVVMDRCPKIEVARLGLSAELSAR